MEAIRDMFHAKPWTVGLFFLLFGAFCMTASVRNWEWVFGNPSTATYSLKKLDGWINIFGRKRARIIFFCGGILVCLSGLLWIWAMYDR